MTTSDPAPPAEGAPDAPPPNSNDIALTINGREIVARKGDLIIKAADDNDEYIPRFCYHNRMEPVGMCRMCLCEVDTGRGPQLVATCMVNVAPGMRVETASPTAKRAQEGMIEMLLANHPLDCPVCDKGGECPLQDQSFSHGPGESRYIEEKRHFEKPIPISSLVYLDRERCILCDRCTRFANEVAGDALIHFTHRGSSTQVNTFPNEPFSSYFSGNTVQICPVGALTATPYRFKARPWDLSEVESTCTGCAVGCRIVVQSSRDEVVRYLGVDSEPVNWGWLCDRGRFGFEATNSADRVVEPLVRVGDELQPTSWNEALAAAATLIREATAAGGPGSVAVLGGAHGSNEDAFVWAQLAKDIIGTPHVDAQLGDGLPAALLDMPRATITDAANAATIVLLGADLKEELPVLYLRLRDAATRRHAKIIEITARRSGLSGLAWRSIAAEPGTQVAAMRQALQDDSIDAQLRSGKLVVVVGNGNLAESADATIGALEQVLALVPEATVLPAFRRGNVVGALQVGMRPGDGGNDAMGILRAAAEGKVECLVLLGCDPLHDVPDTDLARRAMAGAKRVIAVDTFLNDSSSRSHVVLAAAAACEKRGTTSNIEGRVSTLGQKVTPRGTSRPDWMIAVELGIELGDDLGFSTVDEITDAIAATVPAFAGITNEALAAHRDGLIAGPTEGVPRRTSCDAPAPDRVSYDFRLVVGRTMYDAAVGTAKSPSMQGLAAAGAVHLHPLDLERVGAPAGAEVKVSSATGTIVAPVVGDVSVLRGTAWIAFDHEGVNPGELIDASAGITDLRIENL